jgi:hypothetical protein
MRLALRCARDSIPPLRHEILLDLAGHPRSEPKDVRKRIERPRLTGSNANWKRCICCGYCIATRKKRRATARSARS